jgi:hypothetical protein
MATCIRKIGGLIVDDFLLTPQFPNADYWFPEYHVVAELKCLTENLGSKREFNDRVSALYTSWARNGLLPQAAESKITLALRDIPLRCAREFLDPVKRRLEVNILKRANAQIKGLKEHLGEPSAKGLLLLVNDGDYMFPPGVMAHLLARSMKEQYRSIHSVIYFSVNELVTVPGISEPALFWIDGRLPNRDPVPLALRELIQSSWMAHHSSLIPSPIFDVPSNDRLVFENIRFMKKPNAA